MGIGSWFGFGDKSARASEPQPEPAHKVPTSQDLLDAVDRVEQQAKDGKAPGKMLKAPGQDMAGVQTSSLAHALFMNTGTPAQKGMGAGTSATNVVN